MISKLILKKLSKSQLKIIGLVVLLLALPLILSTLYHIQNTAGRAALPDQLETEAGVLSSSGVTKQSDSEASKGQFIKFDRNQFVTPTPPSSNVRGPRPAPAVPTGPGVKIIGIHTVAVDDSGNSDITAALRTIIGSLNAGDTLVFPQGSVQGFEHGDTPISIYRINDPLLMANIPDDITLFGYGTRIVMTNYGNHPTFLVRSRGVQNLKFQGFELYGRNYPYTRKSNMFSGLSGENDSGIKFEQTHIGTTMEDLWIHHQNGDGVQQIGWASVDLYDVADTTLRYSRIEDNSRMGLNPNVGWNWQVHHNIFGNQGGRNINAEDVRTSNYTPPRLSMYIYENIFEPSMWEYKPFGPAIHILLAAWHGTTYSSLGPFVIRDNLITGMQPIGAAVAGGQTFCFNMSWPANIGANYNRVAGMNITGNVFNLKAGTYDASKTSACRVAAVDRLTITNNDFQGFSILAPESGSDLNTNVTISGNK